MVLCGAPAIMVVMDLSLPKICAAMDMMSRRFSGGANGEGDAAQAAKNWQGETLPLENISFDKADLVIDALFGTGLARPVEGTAQAAIEKLTQTKIPIVAVDLPSGVNGDSGKILGIAPHVTLTVTFFRKKIGHCLLPGAQLCGEIIVADIGIPDDVLDPIKPKAAENATALWRDQFPFPKPEGHKYSRGHALIAGGAVMTGATRLAARAAQRMGAGLVTLAAPKKADPDLCGGAGKRDRAPGRWARCMERIACRRQAQCAS